MRSLRSAALVLILTAAGCGSDSPVEPAVQVLAVVVTPSAHELVGAGDTITLTATVQLDGEGDPPALTWSSSAPQVIRVEGSGTTARITALDLGAATVSATAGGESGSASLVVIPSTFEVSLTLDGDGVVTSNPPGLSCTETSCTGVFSRDTSVDLFHEAGSNARFVEWKGDCSGNEGCSVMMDQDRTVTAVFEDRVEDNGLTGDINDLVPDSIIAIMVDLGMPIHRGPNPPSLEGAFLISPLILLSSNVPDDTPGDLFPDYRLQFSDQDDEALTITTDYLHGNQTGEGLGSFIVGSDSTFSVFAATTLVNAPDTALTLEVYSGRMTPDGVEDFHIALFMLDNGGHALFLRNGQGRVGHDLDGRSPRIPSLAPTRTTVDVEEGANALPTLSQRLRSTTGGTPSPVRR